MRCRTGERVVAQFLYTSNSSNHIETSLRGFLRNQFEKLEDSTKLLAYVIALILVTLGTAIRLGIDSMVGHDIPFLAYYLVNVAAMRFLGRGPAVFTILLSAFMANWLFLPPRYELGATPDHLLVTGIFLVANLLLYTLAREMRRAKAQAKANALALREREERLRGTFENAALGIVEVDAMDRILSANERAGAILGYCRQEMLGMSIHELTYTEDRPLSAKVNTEVREDKRGLADYEKRYLKKDGTPLWVHVTISTLRDAQGRHTGAIGTFEDITQRKEAEIRLARQAHLEQFRADVAQTLQSAGEMPALLQQVSGLIADRLEAAFARIWTLDPTGQNLLLQASAGQYTHLNGPHSRIQVGQFKIGRIAQERHPHLTNQVIGDAQVHDQEWAKREGLLAFAGYPLLMGDRLFGVVALFARHELPPEVQQSLGAVSDLLAQALGRKEAEEALRQSELFHRQTLESIPGMVFTTRPDGYCDYQSQQWVEFSGVPKNEHLGDGWNQLLHPDDRPGAYAAWRAAVEERAPYDLEYRVRRHDGVYRWFKVRGQPIRNSEGCIVRWFGVALDIEDLKDAEAALQQSEQQFRTLADSMPNLAWWANADGYIVWYNRRWYEYTGTTPEQMEGWGWQSVHDPEMLPSVQERWKASIATGKPFEMEFPLRGADGQFRWFLTRIIPLRDNAGKVVRWFGTNTDITEAREARDFLARSKEELERIVRERTAKLNETVEELEHFSYTITHDMRAPLRAMQGFGHLLLGQCEDCLHPQRRDFLRRIAESAERMDSLITDALNYTKIIRKDFPLHPVNTDKLLRSMVESYPQFQSPKAEIHIEGKLPVVLANEAGLTQCFSNLLSNAIKFVKPGQVPVVRVWAGNRGGYVRFWFEDNGIGIAKRYQEQIFVMFQRLSRDYEGTGIGLALVSKAAERMQGHVGVESEEGQGSRFWIELKSCESNIPTYAREAAAVR